MYKLARLQNTNASQHCMSQIVETKMTMTDIGIGNSFISEQQLKWWFVWGITSKLEYEDMEQRYLEERSVLMTINVLWNKNFKRIVFTNKILRIRCPDMQCYNELSLFSYSSLATTFFGKLQDGCFIMMLGVLSWLWNGCPAIYQENTLKNVNN